MKGRAPRRSQAKSFNYKHVKHTNEEGSTMKMKIEQKWREKIELQDIWYFPESKFSTAESGIFSTALNNHPW
jgi:hypothetical protein